MVRVKICGLTNRADVAAAIKAGADALGFVLAPSPRQVSPAKLQQLTRNLPPFVAKVGVFVEPDPEEMLDICRECGLDAAQIHGKFDFNRRFGPHLIRVVAVDPQAKDIDLDSTVQPNQTLLLDTFSSAKAGGTGRTFNWDLAREVARQRPIILAGGLKPENIKQAVAQVRPFGVDVSSGVEEKPGRKDHDRIIQFIKRAKSLD